MQWLTDLTILGDACHCIVTFAQRLFARQFLLYVGAECVIPGERIAIRCRPTSMYIRDPSETTTTKKLGTVGGFRHLKCRFTFHEDIDHFSSGTAWSEVLNFLAQMSFTYI